MWEEKDFLKMMQLNPQIYGEEIRWIFGADDGYLVSYFKNALLELLDTSALCESKFVDVKSDSQGIIDIKWKDDFSLNIKQCIDIGNFLVTGDVVFFDRYSIKPHIGYFMSKIILEYIKDDNNPLHWLHYKIVKK